MSEARSTQQHISVKPDISPFGNIGFAVLARHLDQTQPLPGPRGKNLAPSSGDQVNSIVADHVIAAASIGARDVLLVIGNAQRDICIARVVVNSMIAQIVEITLPEHTASVHISRAEAVHSLNEKASSGH